MVILLSGCDLLPLDPLQRFEHRRRGSVVLSIDRRQRIAAKAPAAIVSGLVIVVVKPGLEYAPPNCQAVPWKSQVM